MKTKGYIEMYVTQKDIHAWNCRAIDTGASGSLKCSLLPDRKKVKLIVPILAVLIGPRGNCSYLGA